MFKQLVTPNLNTPYIGGYCEGFVEMTIGQATMHKDIRGNYYTTGVYPTAIGNRLGLSAWDAQPVKHTGLPPKGLSVPVYLSLGSTPDGHVAWSLADGRVASSSLPGYNTAPFFYPNLNALIADYAEYNNGATYLGWGEQVGKIQVIKEDKMIDRGRAIRLLRLTRRGTTEKQITALIGQDETVWLDSVYKSDWFKAQTAKINAPVKFIPVTDKLYKEIA